MNASHLQESEQIASFLFSFLSETRQSEGYKKELQWRVEKVIHCFKTALMCASLPGDHSSLSPTTSFLFSPPSFILLDCEVFILAQSTTECREVVVLLQGRNGPHSHVPFSPHTN